MAKTFKEKYIQYLSDKMNRVKVEVSDSVLKDKLLDVYEECINKYISIVLNPTKRVEPTSWQGKGNFSFSVDDDGLWTVVEYRKKKGTGDIKELVHKVEGRNVVRLWGYIENVVSVGKSTYSRYLIECLVDELNLTISVDAFSGGINRNPYYFPLLYYPLKVLEYKGFIKYGGRGKIIRLVEKFV